jgi:hypothetical protein
MTEPNELKRGRGRPNGASRLNEPDSVTLSKIADLIAADPMLPTTAMRRLNIHEGAATRRLQRKWKKDGPRYLEAAQQRRCDDIPSPRQAVVAVARQVQEVANHMAPAMARLHDHMNSPEMLSLMERARAFAESPQARRMQELANSMEARYQRFLAESPLIERVKEMELAHAKHLQAIADNPSIKQLRERMEDPKFQEQMKQMQRAAEQFSRVGMVWPADPVKRVRR